MTKLRIAKDRKTGRSRGFAYLDFDNKENAEVAVAALAGTVQNTHNTFKYVTKRNNIWTKQERSLLRQNELVAMKTFPFASLIILTTLLNYYEGLQYEGRDLKIDLSEPRTGERTERPKPVRIPSENSVFVGNLGESIANVIPTFKLCNGNTRLPLKFECNYLSLTCYS